MVFTLSGRMKAEEVAELKALFDADRKTIEHTVIGAGAGAY
jgi:hypothetical protein